MKQRKSSLNPNAAPYVPLHMLDANYWNKVPKYILKYFFAWDILFGGYGNLSDRAGEQYIDELSENDLDFLACLFPYISKQSLSDVYVANAADLGASIEMLIQLEDDVPEDVLYVGECTTLTAESSSSKTDNFFSDEDSA